MMSATNTGKRGSDDKPALESVQLDDRGDVVLIVGNPPTYKITVSSAMLALASPVFKAMLGSSKFREGQVARSALEPVEIFLLEDDAEAMLNVCRLLYHQGEQAADLRLYRLLQTMDKYQCLKTFAIQLDAMMLRQFTGTLEDLDQHEVVLLTAIAYLANDAERFKELTRIHISYFTSYFSDDYENIGGEVIPASAILAMSEIRHEAQRRMLSDFLEACKKDHQTPEMLLGVGEWEECLYLHETVFDFLRNTETKSMTKAVGKLNKEIKKLCSGLCLKCVKEGCTDFMYETCEKAEHK